MRSTRSFSKVFVLPERIVTLELDENAYNNPEIAACITDISAANISLPENENVITNNDKDNELNKKLSGKICFFIN
jgi:hypothetical protein